MTENIFKQLKKAFDTKELKDIFNGASSLITGLKVAGKYMIKPTVTMHYPDQEWEMFKDTRNWLRLEKNEETGEHKCNACTSCVRICPCSCIRLVRGKKSEHRKGFLPDIFEIDFSLCCFCGLCVETCPQNAIQFCDFYETASYDKKDYLWNKEQLSEIKDGVRKIEKRRKVSTPYTPEWKFKVDEYKIP